MKEPWVKEKHSLELNIFNTGGGEILKLLIYLQTTTSFVAIVHKNIDVF